MKTTKALKKWNSEDISSWLISIGMKPYIRAFKSNKITGRDLCSFNETDLKTRCKIQARPVRKILFKRLKHIQSMLKSSDDESEDDIVEELLSAPSTEKEIVQEKHSQSVEKKAMFALGNAKAALDETSSQNEKQELKYTPDEASFIIQGLWRCMKSHRLVLKMIGLQYRKVYSLRTGRFIYKYVGFIHASLFIRIHSILVDKTNVSKPINLYSGDIKVSFTKELAIMRIQLFFRHCFALKTARDLARQTWRKIFDPVSGRYFYYHPRLMAKYWKPPRILGSEMWNPMDWTEWTEDDVRLFFRRHGLSRHNILNEIQRFRIDGELLLALDFKDLVSFTIPELTAKKIIKNKTSSNLSSSMHTPSREIIQRRRVLRDHFLFINSAIIIQKKFRRYRSVVKISAFIKFLQRRSNQSQETLKCWWSGKNLQYMVVSDECKRRKLIIRFESSQ